MKSVLLIFIAMLFLTGCVYSHTPYGYSRSVVVATPVYPRYEYQEHYRHYSPPPVRRYYEHEEHHPHFQRQRRYW